MTNTALAELLSSDSRGVASRDITLQNPDFISLAIQQTSHDADRSVKLNYLHW